MVVPLPPYKPESEEVLCCSPQQQSQAAVKLWLPCLNLLPALAPCPWSALLLIEAHLASCTLAAAHCLCRCMWSHRHSWPSLAAAQGLHQGM